MWTVFEESWNVAKLKGWNVVELKSQKSGRLKTTGIEFADYYESKTQRITLQHSNFTTFQHFQPFNFPTLQQ